MLKKSCAPRNFKPAAPRLRSSGVIGVVLIAIENWSMAKSQARWKEPESTKSLCLEIESDDSRNRAFAVGFVTGFGMDYFLVGVVLDLIRFRPISLAVVKSLAATSARVLMASCRNCIAFF